MCHGHSLGHGPGSNKNALVGPVAQLWYQVSWQWVCLTPSAWFTLHLNQPTGGFPFLETSPR